MPRQPGSAVGLPGYSWDDRLRNYVSNDTGRMVKRSDVTDLLRDMTKASEDRMSEFGRLFANDQMSPRAFYEAMQQEVKLATNANASLAKGGWAQLTDTDRRLNEDKIRAENARLWQFARDKQDGLLKPAQIEARANLYANSTYSRYWEIRTEQERQAGMVQERLVTMGDDRVCEECMAEAGRGLVPIGTFNPPIHPGCRCDVEYSKDVPVAVTPEPEDSAGGDTITAIEPVDSRVSMPAPNPADRVASTFSGDNYREFDTISRADASLGRAYNDWADGLSETEREAFIHWQGKEHDAICDNLRRGAMADENTLRDIDALDSAISRTSLPYNVSGFRGMQDPDLSIGDVFMDHGFTTTSANRMHAERYTRGGDNPALARININGGSPASYVSSVNNRDEAEIMLPRGLSFRVTGKNTSGSFPVYDLEVLP